MVLGVVGCGSGQKQAKDPNRPVVESDFPVGDGVSPHSLPQPSALDRSGDRTTEDLLTQAKAEFAKQSYEDAVITLHQVRLRDPWNVAGNTMYQDVRLAMGWKPSRVYGEYRKLFAFEMDNGAALYFMLRPMLSNLRVAVTGVEVTGKRDAGLVEKAEALYGKCVSAAQAGRTPEDARAHFDELFAIVPLHIAGHRLWQDMVANSFPDLVVEDGADEEKAVAAWKADIDARMKALVDSYAALQVKHETSGDARYLYERIAAMHDPVASSLRYARDVLGGVHSYWMIYGMARCMVDRVEYLVNTPIETSVLDPQREQEHESLLLLAELCYDVCVRSDYLLSGEALYGRGVVRRAIGRTTDAVADFKAANELLNTSDPELLSSWIESLFELDKSAEAEAVAAMAMKAFPANGHFVVTRVLLLRHLERHAEGVKVAQDALASQALHDDQRSLLQQYLKEQAAKQPGDGK